MKSDFPKFDHVFDVVVVGAGSAGCVVAARLTEKGNTDVCLIEAGDQDRDPWFHIPMGFGKTTVNPKYLWGYRTEPDAGIANRSLVWTRGKVLGGSGSINGLVFLRGAASDYDEWERQGARGWSYGDVLPFFRRMEASSVGKDEDHGRDGPITITTNKRPSDTAKAFVASCENLQYSRNTDFNSGRIDGVGFVPINVDGRWRHSTASAYLRPNLNRPNLKLLKRTTVRKILFEGKRAIGVEAISEGRAVRIGARKEIVLSGGAINSATLLLSSGVGPADELSALSIDIVHHLPGGRQEPPRSSECRLVLQDECDRQPQSRAQQPLEVCEVDGGLVLHQIRTDRGRCDRSYAVRQDGSRTSGARPPIPTHELLTRSHQRTALS